MISDDVSASVAHDMERVFAKLGGSSQRALRPLPAKTSAPKTAPPMQVRQEAPHTRRKHAAWALAIVLIVLTGFAAFILMPNTRSPDQPRAEATRIPDIPVRPAAPESTPALVATASAPSEVKFGGEQPVTTVRPRAESDLRRPAPKREHAAPSKVRRAETRPGAPTVAATATAIRTCENASDQAKCNYGELLEADRRLRQAYAAATAAGVPTAEMRRARGSWKRALSRSRKEPLVSIGTLDGLTNSLRQSIRSAPRRAE